MNAMKVILAAALLLPIMGCLDVEIIETRIQLRGHGEPNIITIDYANISSDATDTSEVRKDFEELLDDWHGEKFLHAEAEEGLFVKNREVWIRKNKIVGRVTGVMSDSVALKKMFSLSLNDGKWIMKSGKNLEIVDTTGKILKAGEQTSIVWPENATELRVKQRQSELSEAFKRNQPLMVKRLKEYLAR